MIGHSEGHQTVLHADNCPCSICTEHRELTHAVKVAEQRGWIIKAGTTARIKELTQEKSGANHV